MIVVDASAAVELLLHSPIGRRVEARLLDAAVALHAPQLLDIEVLQVLRRYAVRGELGAARAAAALGLLATAPIRRHPHEPLRDRVWSLRGNLTAYDATYVALAEALAATLVTCDARLAAAPGLRAAVEVVA